MIKIEKIETLDPFNSSEYPSSGFYNVMGFVYYVNKKNAYVQCLEDISSTMKSFDEIFNEPEMSDQLKATLAAGKETHVTEDFFFKTIAMIHNGEKFKDIKS